MRVRFDEVFQQNPDGSYSPRGKVIFSGVTMGGPGVSFTQGVAIGGFDVAAHAGCDLEVKQHPDGAIEITGVYK